MYLILILVMIINYCTERIKEKEKIDLRDFCCKKPVAKKPKLAEKDSGHESASSSSADSAD